MTDEILFRGSGGGRALEVGGDLLLFKASRDEGFDSLFIELTSPPGGGPPPHTDPSEELFYVLEGEFEFVSPGPEGLTTRRLQVGDSVCVPRGAPHTYRTLATVQAACSSSSHRTSAYRGSSRSSANPSPIRRAGPPPARRRSSV